MTGSVMIVTRFELTRTISYPRLRNSLHNCGQEESNSQACPVTIGQEPVIITGGTLRRRGMSIGV
jgi:hypothetical protein